MNRRGFLRSVALAAASFAILPGASTYIRRWKPTRAGLYVPNPEWLNAEYEMAWFQLGPPNPWLMPVKPPMEPPRFKKVNGLFVQVHKDGQWDTNRHRPSKETAMNTIH